ncbi:ABC transporter ATP-binding protein [uncultured Thiothrix sp.]|uniref:ABC transporter ATP-binding protein n=1 Tax=uncultured Thiothrix sp. TaxID=223185 RepID=UPI00261FCC56|nr:ABC transporter ATP-binding protein [uncultured Thiothrix sp.]
MGFLDLKGVEKFYGKLRAIKGVDLTIEKGEFIVFVGPSGCGKSTLLRMIAGLETINGGKLMLDGKDITDAPSSQRDLAMVFQSYALYPHMTVEENMSFALRLAKVAPDVIKDKVTKAADKLNLTSYLQRTPKALSGGQRQRVAIGRAIVRQPKVFLFDEPLSNLDAALRGQTRVEIAKLHRELGATTIYVTHDQVEAMTLADRVVVLRDGMIEQVGTPLELYDSPANRFVAQFIGMPQMNVLPASMFPKAGGAHEIGVRPEHLTIVAANEGQLRGTVELIEALGNETLIHVNLGSAMIIVRQYERTRSQLGEQVGVQFDSVHLHRFDKDGKAIASLNQFSGVAA